MGIILMFISFRCDVLLFFGYQYNLSDITSSIMDQSTRSVPNELFRPFCLSDFSN